MITIGNYNEDKPMMEQLNDYEVRGYKFADLTVRDKEFVKGIAMAMDSVEAYTQCSYTGYDGIDRVIVEIKERTADDIVVHLLSLIGQALFSCIDDYPEEDDNE